MKKVLIVMDDINYRGGAHFVTFNIANTWCENNIKVSIFSPVKVNKETLKYLNKRVEILEKEDYKAFDYVIVPFENSQFKEKVSQLTKIKKYSGFILIISIGQRKLILIWKRKGKYIKILTGLYLFLRGQKMVLLTYFRSMKKNVKPYIIW